MAALGDGPPGGGGGPGPPAWGGPGRDGHDPTPPTRPVDDLPDEECCPWCGGADGFCVCVLRVRPGKRGGAAEIGRGLPPGVFGPGASGEAGGEDEAGGEASADTRTRRRRGQSGKRGQSAPYICLEMVRHNSCYVCLVFTQIDKLI
jgi:hypothetical protein